MNTKFIIFIQPYGNDTSQQLSKIKKILSKNTNKPTDVQIIFQNNAHLKKISEFAKQELHTDIETKPVEKIFYIKSKIERDKINYDKSFFLDKFSKSDKNQKIVIDLIKNGISEISDCQSEIIIIFGTDEFFKKEWPFDPKFSIMFSMMSMGDYVYNSNFGGAELMDLPLTPIIIDLRPPEEIYF